MYVNGAAPGPTHDGTSWATAYTHIPDALSAAAADDEIRVATGIYTDPVTVSTSVSLYGGFAGTDADPGARDPAAHPTVLQPGAEEIAVSYPSGAGGMLDGFTVRGARIGIVCDGASPTIANNRFTVNGLVLEGNEASSQFERNAVLNNFEGLHFDGGSPVIRANIFVGQTRSAISCWNSTPSIRSNALNGSGENGTYLTDSAATLANNTMVGNANGVFADGGTVLLANNIVAYNLTGVMAMAGTTVSFHNNSLYGNRTATDGAADPAGSDGNISADPKLVSPNYGEIHIAPDSPCRDAGDAVTVPSDEMDIDGQPRLQGPVDIGADESDGTARTFTPPVIRVSMAGSDTNDGLTWASAKASLQSVIDSFAPTGGDVWIASGEYGPTITARPFVYLYGGFRGTENSFAERPAQSRGTQISGDREPAGTPMAVPTGIKVRGGFSFTRLDGFTVSRTGVGVSLQGTASTLANSSLLANGIGASQVQDAAVVADNTIGIPPAASSGAFGLTAFKSAPTVLRNTITNAATSFSPDSAGIGWQKSSGVIANNAVFGFYYGLSLEDSDASVVNNTTDHAWYGLRYTTVEPLVVNNIFAWSRTTGVTRSYSAGKPRFSHNDVYPNSYSGLLNQTGANGNIGVDPKLRDSQSGNLRLSAGSPAIDAGTEPPVSIGGTDLDGRPRVLGAAIDMGAYEYAASTHTLPEALRALRIAAGLLAAAPSDIPTLDIVNSGASAGRVDVNDTISLLRDATGLGAR